MSAIAARPLDNDRHGRFHVIEVKTGYFVSCLRMNPEFLLFFYRGTCQNSKLLEFES
jgi:hypothetical protein